MPGFTAMLINLLLGFMSTMIGAGLIIFIMRTVRDHKGSVGNLLDAFPVLIRIFCYQVVSTVLIFLWAMLFIIPGIIAAYRYRQGLYLLLDHPEMGIMDCIRTSKNLMIGHKWELFVMDLSRSRAVLRAGQSDAPAVRGTAGSAAERFRDHLYRNFLLSVLRGTPWCNLRFPHFLREQRSRRFRFLRIIIGKSWLRPPIGAISSLQFVHYFTKL